MPVDLLVVLIIILVLVLMWRGPKTLPKLGEALGRGVRGAREEATKVQGEIQARAAGEPLPPAEVSAPLPVAVAPAPPVPASPAPPPPPAAPGPDDQRPA